MVIIDKEIMEDDDVMTLKEAADYRGISPQAISDLISRGRLKTFEWKGRRYIKASELKGFKAMPVGRPRKEKAA